MKQISLDRQGKTYNAIDLTKFICSIFVVMIHIPPFGNTDTRNIFCYLNFGMQNYLARIAVPFFFIASGFFLYKKTTFSKFSVVPSKKYIARIIRLYIIWTLIYFPISFRGFFKDEKGFTHSVLGYIRNTIFTGSYTQLWYLNALIVAVVIISFLLYKKVSPKKMLIIAAILYFIGLFAQSWFGFITPLREQVPSIWNILMLLKKVIVTTRNGLFEGFLFVAIGMCFAFFNINIEKKKAFVGFIVSMILMFFEVFILKYLGFSREYDMYLFLVPATFFLFCFIKEIKLPDNAIFKTLRTLSSLIFYMHMWVGCIIGIMLRLISKPLEESFLKFILTLIVTIICSYIVILLSNTSKFKWLKNLY